LFIVMATYFLIKGNNILGGIFYGLSMGTFIYPLLGIPIVFRYVHLKSRLPTALTFLLVSLVFGALGQGPIFLFYLLHGSGLGGLPVGAGYIATTTVFPPYSVFDIFNIYHLIKFPYLNYLYYGASLFSSFVFFAIPKEKVDNTKLFSFLAIQGLIFSSFAAGGVLMSFPAAFVPFVILFAFATRRNSIFVPLLISFVTLSFAMETINNIGLPIYFVDLNPGILQHTIKITSEETQLAGFLFGISVLSIIPFLFLKERKEKGGKRWHGAVIGASVAIIIAFLVLAVALVSPVIGDVPSSYLLQNPIGSSGITEEESVSNGILHLNYSVYLLALTPKQYYDKIALWLQEPSYLTYGQYNFTSMVEIKGKVSFHYLIGFPSNAAKMTVVSNSTDIVMTFFNNTQSRQINPDVAIYGSNFLLTYPIGSVSAGNYSVVLSGYGSIGVINAQNKYFENGNTTVIGKEVDVVFSFYPYLPNGTVNGVAINGGEIVTVPLSAYKFHLSFSFPGFYKTVAPPYIFLEVSYGKYYEQSLIEGGVAFAGVLVLSYVLFTIGKRKGETYSK
ncbi:MAG: hypothetical protein QW292_08925, partial [Candidatus Parvarchaeota archaeon]